MDKLAEITEGFIKIKKAHLWAIKNADNQQADYQTLLDRLEIVYADLLRLGVSKEFSAALFVFGPNITFNLVKQFSVGTK